MCFSKKIYVRGRGKERKAIVEGEEKAIGEGEGKVIGEGERWNGIEKVGRGKFEELGKGVKVKERVGGEVVIINISTHLIFKR